MSHYKVIKAIYIYLSAKVFAVQTVKGHKYIWKMPQVDSQKVLEFSAGCNLSFPISQTLVSRGFTSKEQLNDYLFTTKEKNVADPRLLKDAQKAVDRILLAIERKEKILVFGDYDVDGITSSSMMMICLLPLGAQVNFYLPNRVRDGYGLSTKIVEQAARNGYTLIVTVDNGITAFEPAKRAKELGVDLIITDHHRQHDELPDAYALVNPNQNDCTYPYKVLAGVGVSFKVMSLLYEQKGLAMPEKAYELMLLGTVADVVPLIGENRFWVRHGLNYVNATQSYSFKVLKTNGNVTKQKVTSTDIGFSVTPQINALGRLEDPRQGVKFLIGSDTQEVDEVGKILLELNQARKDIERGIFLEIKEQIDKKMIDLASENVIVAASRTWPAGVIGLVASRFVGAYGKPTLLFHLTNDGMAKGSCRSIPEFSMFDALSASKHLLEKFGGHAQAAGLSLKVENLPLLKEELERIVAEQLTPEDLTPKLTLDAPLRLSDLNQKLIADLALLEPFGNANTMPSFMVNDVVQLQPPTLLKDAHVKCMIFADGVVKPIIFFNRPELYQLFLKQGDRPFSVAANITENHWNGKVNIELLGLDVAGLGDIQ